VTSSQRYRKYVTKPLSRMRLLWESHGMSQPITTTTEAAKALGVSAKTVQRMVSSGALVPLYTLPTGHLFEPAEVERVKAERDATRAAS